MWHRVHRPAAIVLSLLCLFAGIGVGTKGAVAQEAGDLILEFEDIESFASTSSPQLRILAQEIEAVNAERRGALTWSNPALAYDHEEFSSFSEWQFTLHKRFSRPFTQGSLRDGWNNRVRAAELHGMQATRDFVSDLKASYVQLRLLETHLERLDRLADLVNVAASGAGSRHAEGELSGLDRQIIQLAAYTVEATGHRARLEYKRRLAAWRADMGIPSSRGLQLATSITFRPIDLDGVAVYQGQLASTPGEQAQGALAHALRAQADAARPGLLPGIDVYGGYKRFEPDVDGFVAGVAVDLPLFDRGTGEAGRLEAERLIVENRLAVDRSRREGEVAALVASLRDIQPLLAEFAARFDQDSLADALLISYREGAITLDDLLGAIQIEAAAVEAHHADLATYFLNIFRLEALTGAKLVHFAP